MKGTVVQDMLLMLLHALLPEGLVAGAGLLHLELSPVSSVRSGPQAHPPPTQLPASENLMGGVEGTARDRHIWWG